MAPPGLRLRSFLHLVVPLVVACGISSCSGCSGCTWCAADPLCVPGQQLECACAAGTAGAQVCNADGTAFDECACTPLPTFCTPFSTQPCYEGPEGTDGVGSCRPGLQSCDAAGAAWSPCVGQVVPGIEDCTTPADETCTGELAPCGATTTWSKRFGDTDDGQEIEALAMDDAGGLIAAGPLVGGIDLGAGALSPVGEEDIFVAAFTAEGQLRWADVVGGEIGRPSLATDGLGSVFFAAPVVGVASVGGGAIPGGSSSDAVVAKLTPDGLYSWSTRLFSAAGDPVVPQAIGTTRRGEVLHAGTFIPPISLGCGTSDPPSASTVAGYLQKLTGGGVCLIAKAFGGDITFGGVAADSSDSTLVTGSIAGEADFGGGVVGVPDADVGHLFVAKLGTDLTLQFVRTFRVDAPANLAMARPAPDASGLVFIGGGISVASGTVTVDFGLGSETSTSATTGFVAAIDAGGATVWSALLGPGETAVQGVGVTPSGDVVVSGVLDGDLTVGETTVTGSGAFAAGFGPDGEALWVRAFDGATSALLAVDGRGNVALAGGFAGSVDFGDGAIDSEGGLDAFLADVGP